MIEPYLRFGDGEEIYGEAQTRPCRIEPAPKGKVVYKNPRGSIQEVAAGALMFCEGEPIPVNSRVTVGERCMRVVCCEEMKGFGAHHLEVTLA